MVIGVHFNGEPEPMHEVQHVAVVSVNNAFDRGELSVEPSLGRALIQDALLRFLLRADYELEPGGDYSFTVRASF